MLHWSEWAVVEYSVTEAHRPELIRVGVLVGISRAAPCPLCARRQAADAAEKEAAALRETLQSLRVQETELQALAGSHGYFVPRG
jgi:hypothetical protein